MIEVPAFVVIGGGPIGAGYVRQLLRAREAGRLRTERLLVVDRDRRCEAAAFEGGPVRLEVADWSQWLDEHLEALGPEDHLVPYHWAPHLLREWLAAQLRQRGAGVGPGGPLGSRALPFEATTQAGDRALSYASWICPPTCIEPALCPHTRGPKDWSLAGDLAVSAPGDAVDASIVFRCLHLVYGVGTVPIRDIHAARDLVVEGLAAGPRTYLVATSSHCHALAATIQATPAAPPAHVR